MSANNAEKDAQTVVRLTQRISSILQGHKPQVVVAVLADLSGMVIGGHFVPGSDAETKRIRTEVFKGFLALTSKMIEINGQMVKQKFDEKKR